MDNDTLLLRQIHPNWVHKGRTTSQAFTPTPKDEAKLSVYDGDQITAEASWHHYVKALGYSSAGLLAVTLGECDTHGTTAKPDPLEGFGEHAIIDFTALTPSKRKNVGKILARIARDRGWQYGPVS